MKPQVIVSSVCYDISDSVEDRPRCTEPVKHPQTVNGNCVPSFALRSELPVQFSICFEKLGTMHLSVKQADDHSVGATSHQLLLLFT